MVTRSLTAVLLGLTTVAAGVWKARSYIIEVAGAVCLVVAAALVYVPAAWAVAGMYVIVAAYGIDKAET